ncbi:MAG TPA: S41 family peptidase, partial [Polyangia bacterium]
LTSMSVSLPPMARPLAARSAVCVLLLGSALVACAGKAPAPAPVATAATQSAGNAGLAPPPLTTEPVAGQRPNAAVTRQEERKAIIDAVFNLVRDKHYDKTLGGLDWPAVRKRYEPLAIGAPNDATFFRFVNQMVGELGQSHIEVSGPGAPGKVDWGEREGSSAGAADPGLLVRIIEGKPTITFVRPDSSASRAGLKAGFVVTHIGGWEVRTSGWSARPLRPVEERFYSRVAMARRLSGPANTRVTVRYLDANDRPAEVVLEREAPKATPVKLGLLPPLYPEVRSAHVGDVGVLAFNLFLTEGVLPQVQAALEGFRKRGVRALVIDLRGNPGGQGAVAIPIAARLVQKPLTLGTLHFRDFNQTFTASPSLGVQPFLGPVVIVTDEGSASTAEMFAAGLQEGGRALVVGDTTLGAVLPSQVESLPGGAIMQYVVADFRTPKGVLLEGRGVQPNRRILETRAALLNGRDPVLEAALAATRSSR